jgi:SpoIID/LytB domain protein
MKKSIGLFLFIVLWAIICPLIANAMFSKSKDISKDNTNSYISDNMEISKDNENVSENSNQGITIIELMTAQRMKQFEGLYSEETLKSIAIIIRTQILFSDEKTDFSTDLEIKIPSYISSTKSQVITYDGKIINPPYHISSYKTTAPSSLSEPYLVAVETPEKAEDIKKITTVSKNDFKKGLLALCPGIIFDESTLINNIEQDGNNRCKFINAGNCAISAVAFAEKFSIPSLCFEIIEKNNFVEIISYGEGDGLGLSISGAEIFAQRGMNFEEILSHYYSDIEILNIEDIQK